MFFFAHKDKSIFASTKEERLATIETLIASTIFRKGYYFLLILSILVVTPGILLNNTAIVIGGMVIAPLLTPILLLSLSMVSRSIDGIVHALMVLIISFVIVPSLSYLLTLLFAPMVGPFAGWIPETISPTIYLFIAFCSGITAAFALVKKEISSSIAGIAIVVSLLPPLCTVGVDVALRDFPHASAALSMFGINFLGILVAASASFLVLGFVKSSAVQEKVLKRAK